MTAHGNYSVCCLTISRQESVLEIIRTSSHTHKDVDLTQIVNVMMMTCW